MASHPWSMDTILSASRRGGDGIMVRPLCFQIIKGGSTARLHGPPIRAVSKACRRTTHGDMLPFRNSSLGTRRIRQPLQGWLRSRQNRSNHRSRQDERYDAQGKQDAMHLLDAMGLPER